MGGNHRRSRLARFKIVTFGSVLLILWYFWTTYPQRSLNFPLILRLPTNVTSAIWLTESSQHGITDKSVNCDSGFVIQKASQIAEGLEIGVSLVETVSYLEEAHRIFFQEGVYLLLWPNLRVDKISVRWQLFG